MSTGAHLLLVDDEPQLLRSLKPALSASGYSVTTAASGYEALSVLASEGCDAVVLDLGLPDMDGKEVIRRVREWSDVPIVILTARDIEEETVEALDLGADDFVTKPYSLGSLLARIRAALRGRERRFASKPDFKAGELWINFAERRTFVQDVEVRLTPKEYALVRTLARHAGLVMTHRQIMAAVWGGEAAFDPQLVRVLVGQLRQKIEEEPSAPRLVVTEPGLGYRLNTPDRE